MKKITIVLFTLCTGFISTAQVVTTFCGSTPGLVDGTISIAQFNYPNGICTDANGNIYVSDWGNHRIRKITPAGVVTTLAGSTPGYANGNGTAAQFSYIGGICTDAAGNVYVADNGNVAIRKITPAGVVTTLAGGSNSGFADGTGAAAKFDNPNDVCADNAGNVYVTDSNNNRIRKITPTGVVTTFAGSYGGFADGTGTQALFYAPQGICIDVNGNLYVTEFGNVKIRKVTQAGVVTTIAGSTGGYADGEGSAAQFSNPIGICTDTVGNLYVVDNNRIRKITPSGTVTTVAGSSYGYADGIGAAANFNWPTGICIKGDGDLFVADSSNHKIRKITLSNLGSTQNVSSDLVLKVYPNPVSSVLHLQLANDVMIDRIIITDLTGKVISQQSSNFNSVNVEHLTPGVYFVQAFSGHKKYQTKFSKE